MSEWQPIETAPKNIPILVTDGKVIVVLIRGECIGKDWPQHVGFSSFDFDWDFEWNDLTHWMPLPPPPEGE